MKIIGCFSSSVAMFILGLTAVANADVSTPGLPPFGTEILKPKSYTCLEQCELDFEECLAWNADFYFCESTSRLCQAFCDSPYTIDHHEVIPEEETEIFEPPM